MIAEADKIRRDEPDRNENQTIESGNRKNFVNILIGIIVIAALVGLYLFFVFVPH